MHLIVTFARCQREREVDPLGIGLVIQLICRLHFELIAAYVGRVVVVRIPGVWFVVA
jgi:hypothetical protein